MTWKKAGEEKFGHVNASYDERDANLSVILDHELFELTQPTVFYFEGIRSPHQAERICQMFAAMVDGVLMELGKQ